MEGEYKQPLLKKLEKIVKTGIAEEKWFGETAIAAEARPEDLKNNKIDLFTFFDLKEPILDEETELSLNNLTIGLNFTLAESRDEIKSLLLYTPFENEKKPGFTYICENNSIAPRFVLGLSYFDIERTSKSLDTPSALKARFKLLAEIKAELSLFLTLFPKASNNSDTLIDYAHLSLVDTLLTQALFGSIKILLDKNLLPPPPRSIEKVPRKLLRYTENVFVKELSVLFREDTLAKKSKPFYERIRVTDADTFIQILTLSRELRNAKL